MEQVFMSVTAALLSAAVDAMVTSSITAATLGFGLTLAKALGSYWGTLTYVATYTLMTKFSIDRKLHQAEAEQRSSKFYPSSSGLQEPISLNEKNIFDRILQDTMAAAILAHPGGYYATVTGEDSGTTYTGQLLVSPPNPLRIWNAFGGFLDLLWENIWNMGGSDPDSYTALDYDDINLDYLLMTSELPYYNTKDYYTYLNTEFLFNDYNLHSFNTLGALETIAMEKSGGVFDAIKPNCINGAPHYEFINSTTQETILPLSILYRPVVLGKTRFGQLQPALGKLTVTVQCKDYGKTDGINAYTMSDLESSIYEAKIPLNDNGFEYPITSVFIDVVLQGTYENGYFAQNILINESNYALDGGNLYFTKSIEELVSEKHSGFEEFLSQSWVSEITDDTIFYNVRIEFERFVADTTKETSRLALAQATSYTIMDYFSQYTFAEISANMIGEIAYTETLTFWSTLISAPLAYFGSWAVSAGIGKLASEAGAAGIKALLAQNTILRGLVGMVVSPIKEVFQEIIEDGFREALIENVVDILGGSDDLGFWLSSLSTSWREVKGALGQLVLGGDKKLQNTIIQGLASGMSITEIQQQISLDNQQEQATEQAKIDEMSSWDKLLNGGFLKGLFMTIPAVFFGSFSFVALSGLNKMVSSTIKLASPLNLAEFKSRRHNKRKNFIIDTVGDIDTMNLGQETKQPSEVDPSALHELFKAQQEGTNKENPPTITALRRINPDPRTRMEALANKFKTIAVKNFINEIDGNSINEQIKQSSFTETSKNLKAVNKRPAWAQELHDSIEARKQSPGQGLFEEYHPQREMTIEEMIKELRLDGAREMWGVMVNGESSNSDQQIIFPGDNVKIFPHFQGASDIVNREIISDLELRIILSLSDRRNKIGKFLSETEIDQVIDFWRDAEGQLQNQDEFDSENGPNRNTAHFALFRFILLDKLVTYDIVSSNNYKDLYEKVGDMKSVLDSLKAPSSGDNFKFKPSEKMLSLMHSKIKSELYNKYEGQALLNKLEEFKELFNLQYKIYGYNTKNPFYTGALETFFGWANILQKDEYGNILTFDRGISTAQLSVFYGSYDQTFSKIINRLQGHSDPHPEPEGNIETYLNEFKRKIDLRVIQGLIELDTAKELYRELEFISADYLKLANIYYNNKKALEEYALSRGISPQNTRLVFLKRVSNIIKVDNIIVNDLSEFLFKDKNRISSSFLHSSSLDKRIDYLILESIKNNVRDSNLFDLSKFGKKAVIAEVNKWISEDPFTPPYLSKLSTHLRGKFGENFHIKDLKLVESICKIYTIHEQNTKLSGSKIQNLFGVDLRLTTVLKSEKEVFSLDGIIEILLKAKKFELSEKDIARKSEYQKEINNIEDYIVYRKDAAIAYFNRKYTASRPLLDLRKLFQSDPAIMAFDVMMLLDRDLSTEPIFFDDLDEAMFEQTTRKDENFARQHINPSLYWSLYVSRMFLTTGTYHGVYPDIMSRGTGTISVLDQQICLEGMHILMEKGLKRKGKGNNGLISEQDIVEVFIKLGGGSIYTMSDGRTVLDWWKHGSSTGVRQSTSFNQRLARFNEKIKFKRDNKVESTKLFLKNYQKIAYERFWDLAQEEADHYYLLSRLKSDDLSLSRFLSIPDSDLMRKIFPELIPLQQRSLFDYI